MGRVWIRTPFSVNKNLGEAYNDEMSAIPDGDAACLIDGDCMFTTSDYGFRLNTYYNANPSAVLTCWINRIHPLAKGQWYQDGRCDDVASCLRAAQRMKDVYTTTPIIGSVSGTLLVVPKRVWALHPFTLVNHLFLTNQQLSIRSYRWLAVIVFIMKEGVSSGISFLFSFHGVYGHPCHV